MKWMSDFIQIALQRSSEVIDWIVVAQTVRHHPINFIADSPLQPPALRSARNTNETSFPKFSPRKLMCKGAKFLFNATREP